MGARRHRRPGPPGLGSTVAALMLVVAAACGDGDTLAERRAEVAERGAQVMPFDLDATTHTFTDTDDGGIQTVSAHRADDTEQIALIRDHLREERENFARGDFDDPATIHGHDMEGVAELRANHRDVTITYADVPAGGRLTYATDDPDLVEAIHAWFSRQTSDHGAHAAPR